MLENGWNHDKIEKAKNKLFLRGRLGVLPRGERDR